MDMDIAFPERATSPKKRKHEEATAGEKYELFLYASKNPQLKQVGHCNPSSGHNNGVYLFLFVRLITEGARRMVRVDFP